MQSVLSRGPRYKLGPDSRGEVTSPSRKIREKLQSDREKSPSLFPGGMFTVNSYPASIFVLKMFAFYICCIYSSALHGEFRLDFITEANTMKLNPDQ